jgi:hypothetical protein
MAKFLWIGLKKALGWDRVPGGISRLLGELVAFEELQLWS